MRFIQQARFLFFLFPVVLFSQEPQNIPNAGQLPSGQEPGQVDVIAEPVFVPLSLKQMVDGCEVAILGEVFAMLGSRDYHGIVETDTEVTVLRILKSPPNEVLGKKLIISQLGGTLGGVEFMNRREPPMILGEKSILFLRKADRVDINELPDFGIPRYVITGAHFGRFDIKNDHMVIKPWQRYFASTFEGKTPKDFGDEIVRLKRK